MEVFMKKARPIFLLIVLILALTIPGAVSARKFAYQSGFQVQNLSSSDAFITIKYYNSQTAANQPGQLNVQQDDTVLGLKSNTYFPIHPTSGFNGSVVISSSTSLTSIVNLLGFQGSTFRGAASYVGVDAGGPTLQLPLLMKGNARGTLDTWFTVQNMGSQPTSVTVNYSDGTSAGPVVIAGNASYTFDQQTETHPATVFAGTVVSSANAGSGTTVQNLAAVVVQEATGGTVMAYSGFPGGSTLPVFPLINAQLNRSTQTGILIRNMNPSTPTTVTVGYTGDQNCTETQTIQPNAIAVFALELFAGAPGAGTTSTCTGTGSNFKLVGSGAVISNSANVELVAVVNQITPTSGAAYNGFDPNASNSMVVMPLIMDRNAGSFTGFSIMNLGAPTFVKCSFTDVSSSFDEFQQLGTNQVMVRLQNNKFTGMSKYVGSATCITTDAQGNPVAGEIVGIVNQVSFSAADTFLVYEGINPQ